jgi:hypothetical protein
MQLPAALERRGLAVMRIASRVLAISEEGVTLGRTVLAPFHQGSLVIDMPGISAMLSVAYRKEITTNIATCFRNAERCYKRGDSALANMHLALSGLHAIDLEAAQRLFVAGWAMDNGVSPRRLLKIANIVRKDVVDNVTNRIVQISDRTNPAWIPDKDIQNPYIS